MQCFDVIYDSAARLLNSKVTFTFSIIIIGVQLFIQMEIDLHFIDVFLCYGLARFANEQLLMIARSEDADAAGGVCDAFDAV